MRKKEKQGILKCGRKKESQRPRKKIPEVESRWKPAKGRKGDGGSWKQSSQGYTVFKRTQSSKEILRLCISAISIMRMGGLNLCNIVCKIRCSLTRTVQSFAWYSCQERLHGSSRNSVWQRKICAYVAHMLVSMRKLSYPRDFLLCIHSTPPFYPLHPNQICAFSFPAFENPSLGCTASQ